ncbi:hypothetical protein HJFPF1_00585 [Paramyrothecium foliicola]|nr:hypothetical protein HJFPF1_00585 [Paramyrothecium foliicola]
MDTDDSMGTPPAEDQDQALTHTRRSYAETSIATETLASMPITRSQLSKTIEASQLEDAAEDLLEVHSDGERRIDELLLGVTGAAIIREGTPRGTKRHREAMRVELEEMHDKAKEDRKRRRNLMGAGQRPGNTGEVATAAASSTSPAGTLKQRMGAEAHNSKNERNDCKPQK